MRATPVPAFRNPLNAARAECGCHPKLSQSSRMLAPYSVASTFRRASRRGTREGAWVSLKIQAADAGAAVLVVFFGRVVMAGSSLYMVGGMPTQAPERARDCPGLSWTNASFRGEVEWNVSVGYGWSFVEFGPKQPFEQVSATVR
jgi:hypothetical protein